MGTIQQEIMSLYKNKTELENDRTNLIKHNIIFSITDLTKTSSNITPLDIFQYCIEKCYPFFHITAKHYLHKNNYTDKLYQIIFEGCLYTALATLHSFDCHNNITKAYSTYKHYYFHGLPLDDKLFSKSKNQSFKKKYTEYSICNEKYSDEYFGRRFLNNLTNALNANFNFINYYPMPNDKDIFFSKDNLNFSLYYMDSFNDDSHGLRKIYKFSSLLQERYINLSNYKMHLEEMNQTFQTKEFELINDLNNQINNTYNWNNFVENLGKILEKYPNDKQNSIVILFEEQSSINTFKKKIKSIVILADYEKLLTLYQSYLNILSTKNQTIQKYKETCFKEIENELKTYTRSIYDSKKMICKFFAHYYLSYFSRPYYKERDSFKESYTNIDFLLFSLKSNILFAPDIINYFNSHYDKIKEFDTKDYLDTIASIPLAFSRDEVLEYLSSNTSFDLTQECIHNIFNISYPILCRLFTILVFDYYSTNKATEKSLSQQLFENINTMIKNEKHNTFHFSPNKPFSFFNKITSAFDKKNPTFKWNRTIYSTKSNKDTDDIYSDNHTRAFKDSEENNAVLEWITKCSHNSKLFLLLENVFIQKKGVSSNSITNDYLDLITCKYTDQTIYYLQIITTIFSQQGIIPKIISLDEAFHNLDPMKHYYLPIHTHS